jgi:hypothetical protein
VADVIVLDGLTKSYGPQRGVIDLSSGSAVAVTIAVAAFERRDLAA